MMKKSLKIFLIATVALMLLTQIIPMSSMNLPTEQTYSENESSPETLLVNDLVDDQLLDLDSQLQLVKYSLSDAGWSDWSGDSVEMVSNEFGNRSSVFEDQEMRYLPTNSTTNATLEIETGTDWEAYEVQVDVTNIRENRTWVSNPGFDAPMTEWTLATSSGGTYSSETSVYNATGHGVGDGCPDFFIDSNSGSSPYYYSNNDQAYAQQTMSVPRGDVVWAAFRTDYWADTRDDTHYAMTGAFSIYVEVEGNLVWELVFPDIGAEETWYDSGLVFVPISNFNLPTDQSVTIEVGLWCKGSYGYAPNILPAAKFDNFELYLMTSASPTDLTLEMNGNAISDNPGYGSGYIIESPASPWVTSPVQLNFTWTPIPVNPDPNRTIIVKLDIATNLFARHLDFETVKEINPNSYGERFTIQNATDAFYTTYFYADIPNGYANRYFFNTSIQTNRDVYFVARPLAPATNLTSGWSGGDVGDGYLNVSAYDVATEAGRYGYWRILSQSPNMISDVDVYNPATSNWEPFVNLRSGNDTQIRVYVGASYEDSEVNITIYDPDGGKWHSENATADASGYATTGLINFASTNASAGTWMIQAMTNDVGANAAWRSTGFFKRTFTVTHSTELLMHYPEDGVGTWITNVTYGDLLLIVLKVNDTDSSGLVPGGTLSLDWVLGADTFDDSGNGQYTKVIDTSLLTGKGLYLMDLSWISPAYDSAVAVLTINVNYAAELTSPDYPGISGPIGGNSVFTVDFKNINGTEITGANVWCNWSNPYTAVELGFGSYRLTLDTAGMPIGEYPVTVNASAFYVEPQSMLMFAEIREIYTEVSYSANQLSIPVGESSSFTITWTDGDNNVAMTGYNNSIVCNWTSFHSTGETNYSIIETSPGVYDVTLYTESDDPITAVDEFYTVTFTLEQYTYQNHTFTIGVQVRSHNTQFVLDSPVEQTYYGQDVVILVYYEDTDLLVGITNGTFEVDIDINSPGVTGLSFTSSISTLGDGHYNITLSSDQWGTIGWKNLTITISWTGGVEKYYSQVIETDVRILGTDTDLYLELAPTATYYLNNVTFTTVFWDVVNSTRISNSTNNVFLIITPLTGGHPVSQSGFTVVELGANPGTYHFELNTSLFGSIGTFKFQLDFLWSKGMSPLFENQTMTVTLVVLGRPTYVDYIPVQSTQYGENAEFLFSFIDSLSTEKIANASDLIITLNEGGISFTITYNTTDRTFTMFVDSSTLGGIGTYILHLNLTWVGAPFYNDVDSHSFSISVTLRNTQLSYLSFTSPQWGNNVSIEFVYTDLITGSSNGMDGILSINPSLSGWYDVSSLGNGHYMVVLNTSAFVSNGVFSINASIIYTGTNFENDAIVIFNLAVLERVTQLGYETPDPAPYLNNVSFVVSYVDDSTATPITGANVLINCTNSSSLLTLNTNYWITHIGNGEYLIEIASTALGSVSSFPINVTLTYSGSPFYLSATRILNSYVTERTTQILITQTPGDTPFMDNVTFRFKYSDFLTGTFIIIDKSHVTLSHGVGEITISNSEYSITNYGTYYEISFNSTILSAGALVSNHEIHLSIDKSGSAPYYASRSVLTYSTTIERPTQILFPLVQDTPYLSNATIIFDYIDFISGDGITGATVDISFLNLTLATYYLTELGDGSYRILVPTDQFGGIGVLYFNVSLSISGTPFYSSRIAIDVHANIIVVQTLLIAEVPAIGSQPVGQPLLVNLTFSNDVTSEGLEGAVITTDWTVLFGTDSSIIEIGNGIYRITINTTILLAQEYVFTIQAELNFHETANITMSFTPGASTVEILLDWTTYYAEWGEVIEIRIDVREPYYQTLVPGMDASLLWNGTVFALVDHNNGTYTLDLDTSYFDYGVFEPQITVSREFYQTRQKSFTLVVSKASGQIILEQSVFEVITGTALQFWVYLNDTSNNRPVNSAIVTIEWNNTIYNLSSNGTSGYYTGSIDGTGFSIGQYDMTVVAVQTNYVFLEGTVDINIIPIHTSLYLEGHATSFIVYYGDILEIAVFYNDTELGLSINGANISYSCGGLSGYLIQDPSGVYLGSINTSVLAAQTLYLRIIATMDGYETIIRSFVTAIQPIPTEVSIQVTQQLQDGYYGQFITYLFNLTDTRTGNPISGAEVIVTWDGESANILEHENVSYSIEMYLNLTIPKLYDIDVRFLLQNYVTSSIQVNLLIKPIPTSVIGLEYLSIPKNDTQTLYYTIQSNLDNATITDINAIAVWADIGEYSLILHENGSFILEIPGDLPMSEYRIDLSFTSTRYQIPYITLNLQIRRVNTIILIDNKTIRAIPGAPLEIRMIYWDVDHQMGIANAIPEIVVSTGNITYEPDLLETPGNNGTYILHFYVHQGGIFSISISFSKTTYDSEILSISIESDLTAEQAFLQNVTYGGGTLVLLFAALLFYYIRVWSVPKQIRSMNRMIAALGKGKVPSPAKAPSRHILVIEIVNENLESIKVEKTPEEITIESIVIDVPEVNDLLDRLVFITGLGESEVAAFRMDLSRMKVSERSGFLQEVIAQEEARRAEELESLDAPVDEIKEILDRPITPSELAEMKTKLLRKGMSGDEIEIILQEAENLSKADLEALIDSLGLE
ncbi:MAG: hypothetical protein ACTSV2_13215 [Candidatus Thorarchaeota archaeon]